MCVYGNQVGSMCVSGQWVLLGESQSSMYEQMSVCNKPSTRKLERDDCEGAARTTMVD